jgi:hypothetical protein
MKTLALITLFVEGIVIALSLYMFPPKYDLSIYGGDIYYVKGKHLGTESGRVDTTFATMQELSMYLDSLSAADYHDAIDWELARSMEEAAVVTSLDCEAVVLEAVLPYDDRYLRIQMSRADTIGNRIYHYNIFD